MILIKQRNFIFDAWLSATLDKFVYQLKVDSSILEKKKEIFDILYKKRNIFVYSKVLTSYFKGIAFLEDLGFRTVDTNITFEKPCFYSKQIIKKINVRLALPGDKEQIIKLAGSSFIYSRFHLDGAIPRKMADFIKRKWVENYFHGKRGDAMIVAVKKDKVVGFLLLIKGKRKRLVVDLIAVNKSQRKQGIGSEMINFAQSEFKDMNYIRVGTQIANIPSIRFYESVGFKVIETQYILHYHSNYEN